MGFVDCRDWKAYNEGLVHRGEILLDLDLMEDWEEELEAMNRGKEGAEFKYPDSFIRFLGSVRSLLHLAYRQSEGFVRGLSKFIQGLKAPNYSTINRRVNQLHIPLDLDDVEEDEPITIAVDASGMKVSNRGDWIRRGWKPRKGYLKIHIAVDVKTNRLAALEVTTEKVGDGRKLEPLVKAAMKHHKVYRVLADGAHDSRMNFNFLAENGIDPAIKVRANSVPKSRGCPARKQAVAERLNDPEAWRRNHSYGLRLRAESFFSTFKRTFGEHVTAKKFRNMAKEIALKAFTYNLLIQTTANPNPT